MAAPGRLLPAIICSKKARRIFVTGLVLTIVVMIFLPQRDDTLSVSEVTRFTDLPEKQTSKGILMYPKIKCSESCIQKTVILVTSRASNIIQRETIRQTWGHPSMQQEYNFCLYFLLGEDAYVDIYASSADGDILQVNVTENYFSLTSKVTEAFNWVTQFCDQARFFFKTDDDVFFDLEFLNIIRKDKTYLPDDVLLGMCKRRMPVSRDQSKYHASLEEYPFEFYPPYCGGPGYVMTLNTAKKIYLEMLYTKPFKLEDAYIGMVLYKLGIPVKNVDNFIYLLDKIDEYMQYFKIRCSRITHGLTVNHIKRLWNQRKSLGIDRNHCSAGGKLAYILKYYFSNIFGLEKETFQIS